MASIGQNIKAFREQNGWSQAELARIIGKSRAAISQYENDETTPRMGVIEDLASAFGVKKRDIIDSRENLFQARYSDYLMNDEEELINLYRKLSRNGRNALLAGLREYVSQEK